MAWNVIGSVTEATRLTKYVVFGGVLRASRNRAASAGGLADSTSTVSPTDG